MKLTTGQLRQIIREELRKSSLREELSDKKVDAKGIADKMKTNQMTKAFADKVAKLGKVSAKDLDKMLPDYVDGQVIQSLFKEAVDYGKQIRDLQTALADLEKKMEKAKTPQEKEKIQSKMVKGLQALSNIRRELTK
jgi:GTP1/Obg family GTP-binding protein